MSDSSTGKVQLHSLSSQEQALPADSLIMCVIFMPNKGVEEDFDACKPYHSCLEDSVLHHFAQKCVVSSNTDAVKDTFIESIYQTALKVTETNARLGDHTPLPDAELVETHWKVQAEFENAILDKKHLLVDMRFDGSFVAKVVGGSSLVLGIACLNKLHRVISTRSRRSSRSVRDTALKLIEINAYRIDDSLTQDPGRID